MPQINISDELFEQLTQYCNQSDNGPDDLLRGELLGFGGRDVKVAPGAIIRVPDKNALTALSPLRMMCLSARTAR